MFIPYLSGGYKITESGDNVVITCNFGSSFKGRVRKIIGPDEKKINALLTKWSVTGITFHKFFKPEIIALLDALIHYKYPYGLNIKDMKSILEELQKPNLEYKTTIDYKNISKRMEFSILPHQEKIFERYKEFVTNYHYRGMLIDADPGTGKAQPLYSKILTPNGWVRMGDVKAGDIILSQDRTETKVIGVFPQGKKEIYELTLEDGRKTRCCKEHLWTAIDKENNEEKVLQLSELMENSSKYSIPLIKCDLYDTMEVPSINSVNIIVPLVEDYKHILKALDGKKTVSIKLMSKRLTDHFINTVRKSGGICKVEETENSYNLTIDYSKDRIDIKSIEYVGMEEAQCIKVDHPSSLYVTDDYIVTHNTFSSLALSVGLHKALTIIICPLNTSNEVWVDSIGGVKGKCVFKEPQPYWLIKSGKLYQNEEFIICHYEAVDKLFQYLKTRKNLDEICFIVDESHNMANGESRRTTIALDCIRYVNERSNIKPEVFLLSGTPLKASFGEMVNISRFIDPYFTPEAEKKFLTLYKNPNTFLSKLLTARYTGYSVKVTKDSLGMEEPITQYLKVTLPDGDRFTLDVIRTQLREFFEKRLAELKDNYDYYFSVYKELKQKALDNGAKLSSRDLERYEALFEQVRKYQGFSGGAGELFKEVNKYENLLLEKLAPEEKRAFKEAKTIVKYPELKVQGEALGKIITGNRIACHAAMAATLNYKELTSSTTKKTVVFSSYVGVCEAAEKKCKQDNLKPVGVYGDTVKDLNNRVQAFTKDPKIDPIIATYKSLSTGVPLIAGNVVICLDLPFRMYMYNQAISRVWRLGQDQQVYVYILSLDTGDKPNINSRNIDIITFFKEEVERITGYKSNIDITMIDSELSGGVSMEDLRYDYSAESLIKTHKPSIFDYWS